MRGEEPISDVVIETRGLRRTYQVGDVEVQALRGIDLTVRRSELVAIMGPSGSGKSTLMAILGCLDRPTAGRYRLEGVDVATLREPELARIRGERLGFVFQSFNLLARTSALENVALPLSYSRRSAGAGAERRERARAALHLVGLDDRADNTPGQLSGGQQQRVAIARALINGPAVLLADEPTGNLDTRSSREIMEALVALNRERRLTVIVVTHDPEVAEFADRVVSMRDGRIVSDERRAPGPTGATGSSVLAGDGKRAAAEAESAAFGSVPPPVEAEAPGASTRAFAGMILASAARAIARNTMRSGLTVLGVLIGVAALIAMVAVGQGASESVREQMTNLGTNMIVVLPGAVTSGGVRSGFGSASTLTVDDAEALRRECPAVGQVAYMIRQGGQAAYRDRNWNTRIEGVTPSYAAITGWQIERGRGIEARDLEGAALVAVIGQTIYRQLFPPDESPVGATMFVKGVPLRIVGLYRAKGQSLFGQDQDDFITIPFSTAERKVLGVAAPSQPQAVSTAYPPPQNPFGLQPRLAGYVNMIYVQAVNAAAVGRAIDQVTATLRARHRITKSETADFSVRNLSQIQDAAESSSRVLALLLAAVASISLLVGGIGIMNILLVSVTERTREIGLRMAVGARRAHVLLQFLAEAVFLSAAGGVVGIVVGVVASEIVSRMAQWPIVVSPAAIVGGFLFSAAVGIFFGFYPARQAASLDPIEALRYE
jgi:macrolide transport system ATP-binding/permease protein